LGTGFEYGFTPNWSVGFEYDHLFMGGSDFSLAGTTGVCILACRVGALNNRITQDVDMVTVRFNYRWDWGTPVVAKY
jgi:outer membrane immunogenic protein